MNSTALRALALLLALTGAAAAQDYPNRAIKFMHGFPPGGNVDIIARLLGNEMSRTLGQSVVVETPGRSGREPLKLRHQLTYLAGEGHGQVLGRVETGPSHWPHRTDGAVRRATLDRSSKWAILLSRPAARA